MRGKLITMGNSVGIDMELTRLDNFTITPERIREIVHNDHITSGPGSREGFRFMPTSSELGTINDMARSAIDRGQMIDFGYWPNKVMKETAGRGLYTQGALGHPFSTPYILVHSWAHEDHPDPRLRDRQSCAYLVNPFPSSKLLCIDFEAMAFEGLIYDGMQMLGVGDRVLFYSERSIERDQYCCSAIPFALRFPDLINHKEFAKYASNDRGDGVFEAAAGNVLDPIMTALTILNTRSVPQATIRAPDKLNKARLKSGKPAIPPYRRVDSSGYVTVLTTRRAKGPHQGGTHASPVMHIRQGHWRHYQTGERTFIQDTLVNASEDMRQQFRSHYVVKSMGFQPS